jgi:formylmethanofuran dehydrogenase subunit B
MHYKSSRARPKVEGVEVEIEEAIKKAQEFIADSKNLVIYGLDTSTIEAQKIAIELAERKQAFIDDCSTFCLGDFVEMILKGELPTATLEDVRNNAYVIIYWGTNPYHSLSRHMSRYYYARGKKRQRGYEEDRFLVVIDVRKSHAALLVKNGRFIEVCDDMDVIKAFMSVMEGKAPEKFANDVVRILKEMQKAELNVIFGGLGLKYGLKGDHRAFAELIRKLNEISNVCFIPAGFHPNMRGFNETLFERTGCVYSYSFREQRSSQEFAFSKLIANNVVDTALIIGTDPVNSLPFDIAKNLVRINTIVVDPHKTFTSELSKVVLPSAISGVENGGTMVRSDGIRIEIKSVIEGEINDVYLLERLTEAM